MRVFVLGYSQSGKTTFSRELAEQFGGEVISASCWTERFGFKKTEPDYRSNVTRASRDALLEDPLVAVKAIRGLFDDNKPFQVVEGIRNPTDFVHLFDPKHDHVIILKPCGVWPVNYFDEGVDVIYQHIKWMNNIGVVSPLVCSVENIHGLKETVQLAHKFLFAKGKFFRKCN